MLGVSGGSDAVALLRVADVCVWDELSDPDEGDASEQELKRAQLSQALVNRLEVASAGIPPLVPNTYVRHTQQRRRVGPTGHLTARRIVRISGGPDRNPEPPVGGVCICVWCRETSQVLRRRDAGGSVGQDDIRATRGRRA